MGVAVVDSSVVVAALNREDSLHEAAARALRYQRERHSLAISTLTYAEILVGPLRHGPDVVATIDRFVEHVRIVDVSRDIARRAAHLRAHREIRLPDAVIIATGLHLAASVILTGDSRWKGIETVVVI